MKPPDVKYGFEDLTGQVFVKLTVMEYAGKHDDRSLWKCRCECGNECTALAKNLKIGYKTSCGCRQKSWRKTHDKTETAEYRVWSDMKHRCSDKSNQDYGGRGITVCQRWNEFENFYADMGPRPSTKHSIERKDNNLGYSPDNCKWATKIEQSNNRRSNVFIEYLGTRKTIADWSRELGISKHALLYRLNAGWSAGDILTTPVQKRSK